LEEAQQTKDEKKLKDACRQFESIFITMLLKNMRNTIPEGGYLQKSYPRQVFESMMDEKIAEEITKDHGMGLGQQLYKQLAKTVLKG
jgi:flagellar protein FlgJ